MNTSCQACESCGQPAAGIITLSGPAGVDTFEACQTCATDALVSAQCAVRFVPTLAATA